MIASCVILFGLVTLSSAISFTGDAERDFIVGAEESVTVVVEVDANFGGDGVSAPDVGLPPQWPWPLSGWDMGDLRLAYDYQKDELHIAINCLAICGDADGNGFDGQTSDELSARGGSDLPNFGASESFAVALDLGNLFTGSGEPDGVMDVVLGYPSERNERSERYPCGDVFDSTCFGLYEYDNDDASSTPSQRFIIPASSNLLPHPTSDHNGSPTAARPDLEWTIQQFNSLRRKAGIPEIDRSGAGEWVIDFLAFGGSFQDDGIGEDQFPNNADSVRAVFPCITIDACGICGGDDSTCADCAGVPNGTAVVDECGVCDGDNAPDCNGVPCGPAVEDFCGVCDGDGTSCAVPRAICSEEFGNVCKLHPGDVWAGVYPQQLVDAVLADKAVQFTFAPNNYVMETNVLGSNWNRMVITDDYLAVQQFASNPERVARGCEPEQVAKYTLKFSADCRTLELETIAETCSRRAALYNNIRLTLQKPVAPSTTECDLSSGSGIWQAKYVERTNAKTGRHQVATFTFSSENRAVVESSDSAVYFYDWQDVTQVAGDTRVLLTDRGSQDFEQTCGADDAGGTYALYFGANCERAMLRWPDDKRDDECTQRATRFDELTLIRVPMPLSADEIEAEQHSPCYIACAQRLAVADEVAECTERCENFQVDENEC